jgi:arginyl-tRNA synthetase
VTTAGRWTPRTRLSKAFYNGDYIQDIADDFLACKKTVKADDREFHRQR